MVPEFEDQRLRELIFENYRIVYRVDGDSVLIASVIHSARDVATLLRKFMSDRP